MQSVQYYSDLPYFVTFFFFFKQIKAILTLNAKAAPFFSPVQLQRAGAVWVCLVGVCHPARVNPTHLSKS